MWRPVRGGVVIGMLKIDVVLRPFDRHGFLRRLSWQRVDLVEPADAALQPVMADGRDVLWTVEAAERHRNGVRIVIAEAQRRPAARTEVALGERGAGETRGCPSRPGEAAESNRGERGERPADGFLAHPAVAEV